MVYLFFVQAGAMMTFDDEVSIMESVAVLKNKISEICKINVDQQVLLINGGESLDPKKNICSYMAGTDTNPIYLFSTNYDVTKLDILKHLTYDDSSLKQRLSESITLPVSVSTVKIRTLIAQDFFSEAKQQLAFCEKMVHEQHLQQQGWSAVIANLEDIVLEFRKRWDLFQKLYQEFIADREIYDAFLVSFDEDKSLLMKIPVIDTLLSSHNNDEDETKLAEPTLSTSETKSVKEISLYEWISSDNKSSLDEIYELCKSNLKKFEQEIMPSLTHRITDTLESAEKPERKEIEGLSKRLSDLDELLRKIKTFVESQSDMAQSFVQHQNNVSHTNETSVLPDLCLTHMQQMELIRKTHQKLMEDRSRIVRAKFELSKSLCTRIGWVQNIEEKLYELDSLLVYFHEHLVRLRKHLQVFQQLHLAPVTYMNAVVEVVRRRSFSQLFLMWASDLACQQLTIHNEEVTRRKEFGSQFDGHFLNGLFPGMSDIPPAFAIEAPPTFDAKLPKINEDDVERLKKEVPDFADKLILPDMNHITSFFLGKISGKGKDEDKVDEAKAVEDKLIQAVSDVGLASILDKNILKGAGSETSLTSAPGLPIARDDKGCESETDTEEFEKVGQSPLELTFPQGVPQDAASKTTEKIDVSTITEVRNQVLPPKKPPRSFRGSHPLDPESMQRTLSISSTNESSFTNIKNMSLDSIDELSSIKNFTSTTDSCFNSHYNQNLCCKDSSNLLTSTSSSGTSLHLSEVTSLSTLSKANAMSHYQNSSLMLSHSKSISPQSPRDHSPLNGHPSDFITDEFYIDESLPSSVGTGNSQGSEFVRQLDNANIVVAMLQDNLQISRSEHEQLKNTFLSLNALARLATSSLRNDLNKFKSQFSQESKELSKQYESLSTYWDSMLREVDRNEKEIMECMRRENENQKEEYQYNLLEKEHVNKKLEEDKRAMEDRIETIYKQLAMLEEKLATENSQSSKKIDDLLQQLHLKDIEKERSLKELNENLKMEHRAEIDNIKSRFKLMAMERSPSLTSLEKEKSGDFTSLSSYSPTLFVQMTENFELDREKAILEERKRWELILDEKEIELRKKFEEEKQLFIEEVSKRVTEDKDKQIDFLREREKNLSLEIIKFKATIQQLTENQEDCEEADLVRENEVLRKEILDLHNKLLDIKTELGISKGSTKMFSDLPEASHVWKSDIATSDSLILKTYDLSIDDVVLIYWDERHCNFRILTAPGDIFFLHPDSLVNLGLTVTACIPNKTHCIGKVAGFELCKINEDTEKYMLPRGSTFFLVKIEPVVGTLKVCNTQCQTEQFHESVKGVEKELVQDSGIIENIEQAASAIEDTDWMDEETFFSTQYFPEDREKLLEEFWERERRHNMEISRYKMMVQKLTVSQKKELNEFEEIEVLKKDNMQLQAELTKLTTEREAFMGTSSASCESKLDATTSPLASPPFSDLSRSEIVSRRSPRLNIDSCKPGDVVLLIWDQSHESFKVLQESKHTYFLHSDCFEKLGLSITEGKPNKVYCTGEVVDKEYCLTRKSTNRYKVPKGTKFFRVKVKPVTSLHRDSKDMSHSAYTPKPTTAMSTSHSLVATFDPLLEEGQIQETGPELTAIESSGSNQDLETCGQSESKHKDETLSVETISPEKLEPSLGSSSSQNVEKLFAQDSGIEEATAAIEQSDRYEGESCKGVVEQSTYIKTNWFEAMFRSMFSK